MAEENLCKKIRLKDLGTTKDYLIEEIHQNNLVRKRLKVNYIEHILISTVDRCVSIFNFLVLWVLK